MTATIDSAFDHRFEPYLLKTTATPSEAVRRSVVTARTSISRRRGKWIRNERLDILILSKREVAVRATAKRSQQRKTLHYAVASEPSPSPTTPAPDTQISATTDRPGPAPTTPGASPVLEVSKVADGAAEVAAGAPILDVEATPPSPGGAEDPKGDIQEANESTPGGKPKPKKPVPKAKPTPAAVRATTSTTTTPTPPTLTPTPPPPQPPPSPPPPPLAPPPPLPSPSPSPSPTTSPSPTADSDPLNSAALPAKAADAIPLIPPSSPPQKAPVTEAPPQPAVNDPQPAVNDPGSNGDDFASTLGASGQILAGSDPSSSSSQSSLSQPKSVADVVVPSISLSIAVLFVLFCGVFFYRKRRRDGTFFGPRRRSVDPRTGGIKDESSARFSASERALKDQADQKSSGKRGFFRDTIISAGDRTSRVHSYGYSDSSEWKGSGMLAWMKQKFNPDGDRDRKGSVSTEMNDESKTTSLLSSAPLPPEPPFAARSSNNTGLHSSQATTPTLTSERPESPGSARHPDPNNNNSNNSNVVVRPIPFRSPTQPHHRPSSDEVEAMFRDGEGYAFQNRSTNAVVGPPRHDGGNVRAPERRRSILPLSSSSNGRWRNSVVAPSRESRTSSDLFSPVRTKESDPELGDRGQGGKSSGNNNRKSTAWRLGGRQIRESGGSNGSNGTNGGKAKPNGGVATSYQVW